MRIGKMLSHNPETPQNGDLFSLRQEVGGGAQACLAPAAAEILGPSALEKGGREELMSWESASWAH